VQAIFSPDTVQGVLGGDRAYREGRIARGGGGGTLQEVSIRSIETPACFVGGEHLTEVLCELRDPAEIVDEEGNLEGKASECMDWLARSRWHQCPG